MGIIIGEFVQEVTEINNDFDNIIEEEVITEGLINKDETPNEIKKLGLNIKSILDEKDEDVNNVSDVVNVAKDTLKGKDFSGTEKNSIYATCKRCGISIHGYTKSTTRVKGIEVSNHHKLIGVFKDYILTLKFIGIKGDVKLSPMGIKVNYNANHSNIPKNVVFDFVKMLSPHIDKVQSNRHAIKISALSNAIDSGFPRLVHKYINRFKIKKSLGGMAITLSTHKSVKESSPVAGAMHRQDYNPNAVYIVNYLKKNTFVRDIAVCKDKMSSIFVCDNGEPIPMSLSDFKEMATDIKVYECLYESSFDHIIRLSKSSLDFYKNMVNDDNVTITSLESDYRFNRVPSYIDELESIKECIINSAPKSGVVHEIYCPIIPLVDLNIDESTVHYFRDIDGVFAQNIDTLARSASYKKVEDIPKTTINLLQNS